MAQGTHSKWYQPGDWQLPKWWTGGVLVRTGHKATYEDQQNFYNSDFVKNVLNHKGGMTTLPSTED